MAVCSACHGEFISVLCVPTVGRNESPSFTSTFANACSCERRSRATIAALFSYRCLAYARVRRTPHAGGAGRQLQVQNSPPAFVETTGFASVSEIAVADGSLVVYSATAVDPDPPFLPGGQLTWSVQTVVPTQGGNLFALSPSTGQLSLVGSLAGLAGTAITFTLRVVDGVGDRAADDATVFIRVLPTFCATNPLARFVRVQKNSASAQMHVAEIEVYGPDGVTNLARGDPARGGTTQFNANCAQFNTPTGFCDAALVTDGRLDNYFMTGMLPKMPAAALPPTSVVLIVPPMPRTHISGSCFGPLSLRGTNRTERDQLLQNHLSAKISSKWISSPTCLCRACAFTGRPPALSCQAAQLRS